MNVKHFLTIVSLSFLGIVHSQRYVNVHVDNDLYFGIDRYYSSGIFLSYGKVLKPKKDSLTTDKQRVTHQWTLGQEINTPSFRLTRELSKMDYPYNGWLFFRFVEDRFKQPNFGVGWGIEVGTTGANASFAAPLQNTYHKYILNLKPLSWAYSIPQRFHLNLQTTLRWGLPINKKLKLVKESKLQLGTFRTGGYSRIGMQFGNLEGLPFFGNRVEYYTSGSAFFLGNVFHYSLHDYSLTGSAFTPNSPFDFDANHFVNTFHAGIVVYTKMWTGQVLFNSVSKRVVSERFNRHPYLTISLTKIFN